MYWKAYGSTAAEIYERHLVPAIFGPWAEEHVGYQNLSSANLPSRRGSTACKSCPGQPVQQPLRGQAVGPLEVAVTTVGAPDNTLDRAAGSPSLAAAGQRARWASEANWRKCT